MGLLGGLFFVSYQMPHLFKQKKQQTNDDLAIFGRDNKVSVTLISNVI